MHIIVIYILSNMTINIKGVDSSCGPHAFYLPVNKLKKKCVPFLWNVFHVTIICAFHPAIHNLGIKLFKNLTKKKKIYLKQKIYVSSV